MSKAEFKCPWCSEVLPRSEIKKKHIATERGKIVERRCAKCDKVVAAYVEGERDFLPRIRTF